ncbi:hypothetical protein QYM36_008348, partial [Artemia franciscana]
RRFRRNEDGNNQEDGGKDDTLIDIQIRPATNRTIRDNSSLSQPLLTPTPAGTQ